MADGATEFVWRVVEYDSNPDKALGMQRAAVRASKRADVQRWAKQFTPIKSKKQRARAILRFVQFCITYLNDPGREVLDRPTATIARGYGDCDAKATLFVALCLACGLNARIHPMFIGNDFPHVLAEVQTETGWELADATILNSDVGDIPTRGARTNEGSWLPR